MASVLFSTYNLGSLQLPNRFVRSATHDFMAGEGGQITPRQINLYQDLAKGEVGLIITGHAFVNPRGQASPRQIGVWKDELIPGLKKLVDVMHSFSSTRIFLQLAHAGRQTKEKISGGQPLAPSSVYEPTFRVTPKAMSEEEIQQTINDFIQGARRAREAGFDGIQLHVAHGYLLSSFLSPYTNRRQDKWGGSLENRVRIVQEIVRGIRKLLGREWPIIAKINATDFLPSGLQLSESISAVQILEADGVDAFEISGGMAEAGQGSVWKGIRTEEEEGYFVPYAEEIKKNISSPVFGLGGLRTFSRMEELVATGKVDLISMSRPFIRDPDLIKKFRMGLIKKSECISCNQCFNPRGIKCAQL